MTNIYDIPYPIYDLTKNLKLYLLPVSDVRYDEGPSSDQRKIKVNTICEGFWLIVSSIMMKKWLLLKNIPISRLEYKIHTLFMTKVAEIS